MKAFIMVCGLVAAFPLWAHGHVSEHASQQQHEASSIKVTNAWARATFALATTGAVYFSIENTSDNAITLLSAKVSKTLASEAQIHETLMEDEMMLMREVTQGVLIAPHSSLDFAPGGKHVMLLGLTGPLNEDDSFDLRLHFDQKMKVTVPIVVKKTSQMMSN